MGQHVVDKFCNDGELNDKTDRYDKPRLVFMVTRTAMAKLLKGQSDGDQPFK